MHVQQCNSSSLNTCQSSVMEAFKLSSSSSLQNITTYYEVQPATLLVKLAFRAALRGGSCHPVCLHPACPHPPLSPETTILPALWNQPFLDSVYECIVCICLSEPDLLRFPESYSVLSMLPWFLKGQMTVHPSMDE